MKSRVASNLMLSAARHAELEALEQKKTLAQRKGEFNESYGEWIAAQNDLVERVGVFGEDHRPW